MRTSLNSISMYSIFNILLILLLIVIGPFFQDSLIQLIVIIDTLALFNIVILYYQLRKKNKMYDDARLKSEKLLFLNSEIQRYKQHRHDIKNHLVVIRELANMGKLDDIITYTEKLTDDTSRAIVECKTGLDELDVLLYTKRSFAEMQQIDFKLNLNINLSIDKKYTVDIISIIANILDNAIEATTRIEIPNERMIQMNVYEDKLGFHIIVTNSFSPKFNVTPVKALAKGFTTKANNHNHGLGLSIIKKLVKRYGGTISIDIYNGVFFQIKIELPKHNLMIPSAKKKTS